MDKEKQLYITNISKYEEDLQENKEFKTISSVITGLGALGLALGALTSSDVEIFSSVICLLALPTGITGLAYSIQKQAHLKGDIKMEQEKLDTRNHELILSKKLKKS